MFIETQKMRGHRNPVTGEIHTVAEVGYHWEDDPIYPVQGGGWDERLLPVIVSILSPIIFILILLFS